MERQLDNNIFIEGMKLFVNKPKFQRGGKRDIQNLVGEGKGDRKQLTIPMEPNQRRPNSLPSTNMKSYAEAVKRNPAMKEKESMMPLSGKYSSEPPVTSVTFHTSTEDNKWLDQAWVGRIKNRGMFERVVEEVQEVVGEEVKVSYWGDDMIILFDMDEAKAGKINLREQSNGETPLYSIQKWTPEMKTEFRLIWIHIWGVPLEIWGAEHFATLLSTYGELIELDEETEDRSRLDVARVLLRTEEKPFFFKSMVVTVNGTEHQLVLREDMPCFKGKRQRRPESEIFLPSPFTTAVEDSDDGMTVFTPDGASSNCLRDRRRRRWTRAINLWRTESEAHCDDDASLHRSEAPSAVGLSPLPARHVDYNGPLHSHLHGHGILERRDSSLGQQQMLLKEKAGEGPNEVDSGKGADLWVVQHDPEDINLVSYPLVKPNSNLSYKETFEVNNTVQKKACNAELQDLGLITNGPTSKGEESVLSLKVYSRRKEGVGRNFLAHLNSNSAAKAKRDVYNTFSLDLTENDTLNKKDDMAGDVQVAEVASIQHQHCLSPILSSSFNKAPLENKEDFHLQLARDLGLSFEEHKHSSVNMKTAKVASEHTAEVTAVMGKDKIDS